MLCSSLSLVPRGAPASTHLDSRQDLLGRFGLIPSYDLYVRPYVRPANVSIDKGKTKDTPQEVLDGTNHRIPHGLKSFLADLPGKTSTKKKRVFGGPHARCSEATNRNSTLRQSYLGELPAPRRSSSTSRESADPRCG